MILSSRGGVCGPVTEVVKHREGGDPMTRLTIACGEPIDALAQLSVGQPDARLLLLREWRPAA